VNGSVRCAPESETMGNSWKVGQRRKTKPHRGTPNDNNHCLRTPRNHEDREHEREVEATGLKRKATRSEEPEQGKTPLTWRCSRPDKSETLGMEPCRWVQEIGHCYPVGEYREIRNKSDLTKGRHQVSSEPACVPVRGGMEPGVGRVQAAGWSPEMSIVVVRSRITS
jgi:hypothetical protein